MGTAAPVMARRRRLSGVALVLAVLVLGGGATTAAALTASRSQQRLAAQEMDHYVDDVSTGITEQVSDYSDALTDLAVGVSAQQFLSAADFATLSSSLDNRRLPGARPGRSPRACGPWLDQWSPDGLPASYFGSGRWRKQARTTARRRCM